MVSFLSEIVIQNALPNSFYWRKPLAYLLIIRAGAGDTPPSQGATGTGTRVRQDESCVCTGMRPHEVKKLKSLGLETQVKAVSTSVKRRSLRPAV